METNISFLGLFVLAGLVGLAILAVLGLVGLLTHPKTRDAAKTLFVGLAAIAVLVVLLGGFVFVAQRRAVEMTATTQQATVAELARLKAIEATRRADAHEKASQAAEALSSSPPVSDTEKPAEESKAPNAEDQTSGEKETAQPVEKGLPEEKPADSDGAGADAKAASRTDSTAVSEDLTIPPAAESASDQAGLLNVGLLLEKRPEWAGRRPYKENSIYCWPVVTDPRPDVDETLSEALPEAVRAAVGEYVETKLELGSAAARQVGLDPDYAMAHLIGNDLWTETVDTSFGPWVRLHALVKFDHEANVVLKEHWAAAQVTRRLWGAAAATCVVLFLLAVAYCYLKIDLLTGGSRRWLLRFAVIVVILVSILVTGGLARMIHN